MPKSSFKSVDDYIAQQPEAVRGVLERVRTAIRNAVPGAEESISYGIPTYKLGRPVICFGAWKRHYSVYPVSAQLMASLGEDARSREIEKGTIRFNYAEPVPVRLIGCIAKARVREVAAGGLKPPPVPRARA
jgi:uncharacterized protein YdhG (YjbR/CyaY superfamily)